MHHNLLWTAETIFYYAQFFAKTEGTLTVFHKTLPKSSLQMHFISVRFFEMDNIKNKLSKLHICMYVSTNNKYNRITIFLFKGNFD